MTATQGKMLIWFVFLKIKLPWFVSIIFVIVNCDILIILFRHAWIKKDSLLKYWKKPRSRSMSASCIISASISSFWNLIKWEKIKKLKKKFLEFVKLSSAASISKSRSSLESPPSLSSTSIPQSIIYLNK